MDAKNLAEKVQEHGTEAKGVTRDFANKAQQATEQAKEAGRELANKAGDASRRAKGVVKDAGAAVDLYLHEYAWTTLVTIALVSGAVGYMLGRKS